MESHVSMRVTTVVQRAGGMRALSLTRMFPGGRTYGDRFLYFCMMDLVYALTPFSGKIIVGPPILPFELVSVRFGPLSPGHSD